ncbi:MAG: pantetheine-phosphate adenylyltransferase [Nitrospira sp.]|nr:pantetheine-phosphate adenylyltransferase [Candidatus Manganitrophaceae bacterium]HIL34215.1 pantetheine-phosphate adenylyltransferase [Candidatus Manganitrophaceae bacterium]
MAENEASKLAIYPGTFDPITNGHLDIAKRALHLFPNLVLAIAPNAGKKPLFSLVERLEMIRQATKGLGLHIESFNGLLVDYVAQKGASAIIRGIRAVSDFEFEFQMALMNRKLDSSIETVFLMPSEEYSYLTSTLIKEVASYGGNISSLVPKPVIEKLLEKYGSKAS